MNDVADKLREYAEADNIDYAAYTQIEYFVSDATRIILGLVFCIIFMTFALMVALDVAYLTMPVFQDLITRKGLDGSLQEKKVKLISSYARNARIEADTVHTGKSAMSIYVKSRTVSWIQFILILMVFLAFYTNMVNGIGQIVVEVYLRFKDLALGIGG